MKLRQNEEKEIDLRTIVDGELSNRINTMLPLDGSKKMTGVLETVGGVGAQIKLGDAVINYIDTHKKIQICSNCYAENENWHYKTNGMAFILEISNIGYPAIYRAPKGIAGQQISFDVIEDLILTGATGVKKNGDTMTGDFTLYSNNYISFLKLISASSKLGAVFKHNSTDQGTIVRDYLTDGIFRELRVVSDGDISSALVLGTYPPNNTYRLYGGHNKPYIEGGYTGDGTAGRTLLLGFFPTASIVWTGNGDIKLGFSAGIGGIYIPDTMNQKGANYGYLSFK